MTSAPFDPVAYADQLRSRGESLYAQGMAQRSALESLSAEATAGPLTVTVALAGRLTGCRLQPGASATVAQLGTAFRRAYDQACTSLTAGTASYSGGLDAAVASLAPVVGDESGVRPAVAEWQVDAPEASPDEYPLPVDDEFDRLLATLDGAPEDIESFVNDPLFQRLVPTSDPSQWQAELQAEVARLSSHADELAVLATRTTAEHSDNHLTVTVSATGRVEDLSFRPAALALSADDLEQAVTTGYRTAAGLAEQALQEAVAELGLGPGTVGDDRPIR